MTAADAFKAIFADFTPGAAGIWTGVLMFAGYLMKEWRENRKLSAEDRLARREGYERQVQLLTAENRALATDQRELRQEYDHYRNMCQDETDQLRQQLIKLQNDMAGLRRRADTLALDVARIAGEDNPEIVRLIEQFKAGRSDG